MIRIENVHSKDAAYLWLKEKIDADWKPAQIRQMMNLASGFPSECKLMVEEALRRIELLESDKWSHIRLIICSSCGYKREMRIKLSDLSKEDIWKPGTKCPKCSSEEFYPAVGTEAAPSFVSRISAYATQNVRSFWLTLLAIVLFLVGTYTFISQTAARHKHFRAVMVVKCENCGFMAKVSLGPTPVKCPKCKKKQMYNAVECAKCGTMFTHRQPPDYSQAQGRLIDTHNPPKCPKCGSGVIKPIRELKK